MLGLLASIGWIFPGKDSGEQDEFNQQQPWLAEVTYGNVYHASCEQIQGPGQEPCTFARHIQQQPAEVHGQSRPGGWAELPGCVVYELPDNNQQQRLVSVEDALRERP
ncbi:hypothetical protein AJ79_06798 [Helicocarpus griseus UAMH5409]|uniref:Uncharacterized protein n=1 Tax=Helicocarpus griseus UAMH5409 TaxID=1447875 RepID=A0A2B7X9Q2_9EURO|nr:hypothetical protein AJ79_06798 [Helicocarpus griseus UAMH5409]